MSKKPIQTKSKATKAVEDRQFRQGDVFIERIAEIPAKAVKQKKSGTIILAHGTATGHHHTLTTTAPVKWFKEGEIASTSAKTSGLAGEVYVSLPKGGKVTHEEHATIQLPPGDYRVTRQREYTPTDIRNVQD